MRKTFSKVLFMLMGMMTLTFGATAQVPGQQELPLDPNVRVGQLPNGLTYFIRHNETPKGQADFYIAQKVGSILEEDNQRGLAHFLEHMCFNGTENFEGNEVVQWLQTKGVQFGGDLNAYTSIDETVYNISNVPVDNVAVQDSCLLILHDWADGLLLATEEIDKERGVIHEEWRSHNSGQQRLLEMLLPTIYPGSKYGYRMPIGTMEVVDNFPPQALRDYYETWYRPDQQGIVVVGDIDVDRIENKIKEIFSPIKMPENPKERVYEPVPDTPGTIYAIGADPEMQNARITVYFKTDALPREMRNTPTYLMMDYAADMFAMMLGQRLDDIAQQPDSPFAAAGAFYGGFLVSDTKDALTIVGIGKGDDIRPTLAAIYRELLRVARGGFTISEYDRARSEYLSRLEKAYNNRAKTETSTYVNQYVRHFIDNDPMMDIEQSYPLMQSLAQQIPVDLVNQMVKEMVTDDNRVVVAMLPEKDGYKVPTEAELAEVMTGVDAEDIPAFVDEVKSEPLIPALPAPGKIVSEKKLDKWGATEWTLSNGAKVVFKSTDFKADEILFDAQALGGTSVFSDDYNNTLRFFPISSASGGLGDYTNKDLQKYLQGKQASVGYSFDAYVRDVAGSTTPKDLPVLMELIYMSFTNFTITEDEFLAAQNLYEGLLHNQETNPQFIFSQDLSKALYENSRRYPLDTEAVKAAQRGQTIDIVKKMTANAADYTFYFVGSINEATFRPLVEQYIASLPGNAATAVNKPDYLASLGIKAGAKEISFKAPMQTPQTYVAAIEYGELPYTMKERAALMVAGDILSDRLLKDVREDRGAVYSIWASGSMQRISNPGLNTVVQSVFPMKPEMREEVFGIIRNQFKALESNITAEELAKTIEYNVKSATEAKDKNNAWMNAMAGEALNGVDTFNGNVEMYKSLTIDDVQNAIKKLNEQGNLRFIYLEPEEATAAE